MSRLVIRGLKGAYVCPHIQVKEQEFILLWRKGFLTKTVLELNATKIYLIIPTLTDHEKRDQTIEIAQTASELSFLKIVLISREKGRYHFPANVEIPEGKISFWQLTAEHPDNIPDEFDAFTLSDERENRPIFTVANWHKNIQGRFISWKDVAHD